MRGIGREVAKKFNLFLVWRPNICERKVNRLPSDAWHSSSASTTINTL
jgi:hypothetical protein